MSTPYRVIRESLAAIRNNVQLIGGGSLITSFTVLEFPPATIAFVRIGMSGEQIPLTAGLRARDLCETEGLYLDIPVVGAGDAVFAIFTSDGALALGT